MWAATVPARATSSDPEAAGAVAIDHELAQQPLAVEQGDEGQGPDALGEHDAPQVAEALVGGHVVDHDRFGRPFACVPRAVALDRPLIAGRSPATLKRMTPSG